MADPRRSSFATRHLDPASHMGEILFRRIMTLTFALAAGWLVFARVSDAIPTGLLYFVGWCAVLRRSASTSGSI